MNKRQTRRIKTAAAALAGALSIGGGLWAATPVATTTSTATFEVDSRVGTRTVATATQLDALLPVTFGADGETAVTEKGPDNTTRALADADWCPPSNGVWTLTLAMSPAQTAAFRFTIFAESGEGTADSPYSVTTWDQLQHLVDTVEAKDVHIRLGAGSSISGTVTIPAALSSVVLDLNGGSITGDDGKAGVLVEDILATRLSLTGTGTVSGGGDANSVETVPRVSVASTVTVSDAESALTLDVDGVRLIYRDARDLSDIERLIRLIVENATTPVKAAE